MADLMPDAHPERRPAAGVAAGGEHLVARRDVRVSDAERHAVVDELRVHFGAGRLEMAEFEERCRSALSARVRGDLHPLLDDLPDLSPVPAPAAGPPVRPKPDGPRPVLGSVPFRIHFYLWLLLSAFFVVIWGGAAMAGADAPFWPVFPIAGTGLTVGVHAAVRKALEHGGPPPVR